jgi:uncharacterized protein
MNLHRLLVLAAIPLLCLDCAFARQADPPVVAAADRYTKREVMIPMRDGVKLFTAIYSPKDTSKPLPILLRRTPYSCRPYGDGEFPKTVAPSKAAEADGFIVAVQDVRGRYMSEGDFVDVRPLRAQGGAAGTTDENTDTYDTIDWLLANVAHHNGNVGMWGISYPGFYAAIGMIDAHPALKAVSPQAPIADWFFDDFHHHGAFFLPHFFNFYARFGTPREGRATSHGESFEHWTPDGYEFFLDLGPLSNIDERYYKGRVAFWPEFAAHPNHDEFWRARDLRPRLRNVAPAVLTVGGWFDAEDLFGAINVYRACEDLNPWIYNALVMGPWVHGGWARGEGSSLGAIHFGAQTSPYYQEHIELPFFRKHLKGEGEFDAREAYVFETGTNVWRRFDTWPPRGGESRMLYLGASETLRVEAPANDVAPQAADVFVSDPAKPVPFTQAITTDMNQEYMVEDQRFAARRPDVLVYRSEPLAADLTIAGPLFADLFVSTSEEDADWVVKLIDVLPPDTKDPGEALAKEGFTLPPGTALGSYQMMVRSEVFRGRFREDYSKPRPFTPNEPTLVTVPLVDVLHTFKKGHRIMVQVQSTWFPLVDRNPQNWVDNIFSANADDYVAATHKVYRAPKLASKLRFAVLPSR